MQSEKELNSKILEITMTIREKYPELYEHLGEMPVTIPNIENPEINNKNLRDYYDSLKSILKNYVHEHLPEGTK
ncbi:MAG: hypothetical protein Q8N03_15255 [Ignavibacteria bacterium]|nr:hypothetical protein [Ignavibacteria bacterium]